MTATLAVVAALALGFALAPAPPAGAVPAGTEPYTVARAASGTSTPSHGILTQHDAMSADGRYVAFTTTGGDLGPTDTNAESDVYLWDRDLGTTTLVSVNVAGTDSGNNGSDRPSISANGRYVAFVSEASDLTSVPDVGDGEDVFIWDRVTGATTMVSTNAAGSASGDAESQQPELSADGSTVAFSSYATDLTASPDAGASSDVFRWDRATGTTTLLSATPAGTPGDGGSTSPRVDADGSHIAFTSSARDLVAGVSDPLIGSDVFLWSASDGVRLLSRDEAGTGVGNYTSGEPAINATGTRVAFTTYSDNLVAEADTNVERDVFLWRAATDDLTQVSRNATGTDSADGHSTRPQFDASGSVVLFYSTAGDLGPVDTNGELDLYHWSATTGESRLVSANAAGTDAGDGPVVLGSADLSADGDTVSFASLASDHTDDTDSNGQADAFVTDGADLRLLSSSSSGAGTADERSLFTLVAPDGSSVLFESNASDLDAAVADGNGALDLFMVDGPGALGFDAGAYEVDESDGTATLTVVRRGGRSTVAEVLFVTSDGTATEGADYDEVSTAIPFAAGQRVASVAVPIVDDARDEDDETVELALSAPTGGAALGTDTATLTIVDDDEGAPQPIDAACPAGVVPTGTFPDAGPVHGPAIDCLAWWGLVTGYSDGTFGTGDPMTRGQYASVMVRLLDEVGGLPPTAPDAFPDDDGDVHELSANRLAAVGLFAGYADGTARLGNEVTRAELSSMVFRVAEHAGLTLPPGEDRFDDVDGVHEEAIERLAAAGLLVGVSPTEFGPSLKATRGQVSSLTTRFLAVLVEEAIVDVPVSAGP